MLFGKSLFQSVVERLAEEAEEVDDVPVGAGYRVSGLSSGFVAESVASTHAESFRLDAYLAMMPETVTQQTPGRAAAPAMPKHLARLTIEEIAEDLDLRADDNRETLTEKRRAFARLNHPDGQPAPFRGPATTRMKIANLLVDEAIRTLG
ncbi:MULTISPECIES: hypothetical protein [Alphaproteobacteria]|uniref:J domain-containing protein n=2 Tax=Alphaproteobacteria TaxID=28211 RepID=A0A512HF34_9HYPH|nr:MULTISPECIES: hypothetical protein [Alphaproteobacteria]GEO84072.1 hypothetical protein RNA01_10040 [Ciceribacter naphthalenivorans]GLR21050.1 hypothetical protein GCM10007920_08360 [Ciceribacter naphthalenivorans]GLT03906.1 hypothetical protein GCM10007926_08360 [Sphingomonas psychrolutea]